MGIFSDLAIELSEEQSQIEFENDIQESLDKALEHGHLTEVEYQQSSIDLVNEDYGYLFGADGVLGDLVRARNTALRNQGEQKSLIANRFYPP
jgi:hypothetical protein